MATDPSTSQASPQDDVLKQVEQLIEELHLAMTAVSQNCVEDMERSLWRQEMLCAAVERAIERLRCLPRHSLDLLPLRSVATELERSTRSYESLAQQGKRTVAPLLELCHLYCSAPASPQDSFLTPLSCEA